MSDVKGGQHSSGHNNSNNTGLQRETVLAQATDAVLSRLMVVLTNEVQLLGEQVSQLTVAEASDHPHPQPEQTAAIALSQIVRTAIAREYPEAWDEQALQHLPAEERQLLRGELRARVSRGLSSAWADGLSRHIGSDQSEA